MKALNLTGMRFGRLVVTGEAPSRGYERMLECQCDCGNKTVISRNSIRSANGRSCGCLRRDRTSAANTTHGLSGSRLEKIFKNMKNRCTNPKDKHYKDYGGRGITICKKWMSNRKLFFIWALANGYRDGLSIDRIKNNKGYSPKNCRWVTQKVQANNKRGNRVIKYRGLRLTVSQWAARSNIHVTTLRSRISAGWGFPRAIAAPLYGYRRSQS